MLKFLQKNSEEITPCASSSEWTKRVTSDEKVQDKKQVIPSTVQESVVPTASKRTLPLTRPNLFGIHWKHANRTALVTLCLATVVGGRWYVANQTPTYRLPSTERVELSRPNAAHFYSIAADSLTVQEWRNVDNLYANSPTTRAARGNVTEIRQALPQYATALTWLRQGFEQEYRGQHTNWMKTVPTNNLSKPVPDYIVMRCMARLLAIESQALAAEGKTAQALSSAIDAIHFGQDIIRGEQTLTEGMIGTLAVGIGTEEATNILRTSPSLSSASTRPLTARLENLIAREGTFGDILRAEQSFGNGTLQEMFNVRPEASMNLLGSGSLNPLESIGTQLAYTGTVFVMGKQGIVDRYNHRMDTYVTQTNLPYAVGSQQIAKKPQQLFLAPIEEILIPNMKRAYWSFTVKQAQKRVILAQLAVEAYKSDHNGTSPKTLSALTEGAVPYLKTVPTDPFSPTGQDPLRYQNGRVSSVGANEQGRYLEPD